MRKSNYNEFIEFNEVNEKRTQAKIFEVDQFKDS